MFLDGNHLGTAWPKEALTADDEDAVKRRRVERRRLAQNRGTVANRTRRANARDGVHKLHVDKHGNRHVVGDDVEDLFDGPDITIDDLVQVSHDNSQGSLFA